MNNASLPCTMTSVSHPVFTAIVFVRCSGLERRSARAHRDRYRGAWVVLFILIHLLHHHHHLFLLFHLLLVLLLFRASDDRGIRYFRLAFRLYVSATYASRRVARTRVTTCRSANLFFASRLSPRSLRRFLLVPICSGLSPHA